MFIDLILALILVWSIVDGIRKGFVKQICSILAFLAGVWGASHYSDQVGTFLAKYFPSIGEAWLGIISFAVAFLIILLLMQAVEFLVEKLLKIVLLGWLNRLLGAAFSLLKYALVLSVIICVVDAIVQTLHLIPAETLAESKLYGILGDIAPRIFPHLHFDAVRETLKNLNPMPA
ncbi:MAG: CvpA family protein [Bacteroidales bacterium]|nr:CvpA family protein [Bacteroidales bacterium]MCR5714993.1 CvpA family protein [Bacteroidales bacterium]